MRVWRAWGWEWEVGLRERLTWSSISIQNCASCGSRLKTKDRPSFDDRILVRVLMDSASSVMAAVRAFSHCPLKSAAIAFGGL